MKSTGANKPDPGKSDLFPWIAAGANGLLDVVWYHGEGGAKGSNLAYRDPGDKNTKWTVAFAQLGKAASRGAARSSATARRSRRSSHQRRHLPERHVLRRAGAGCSPQHR